jgi:kynureninase
MKISTFALRIPEDLKIAAAQQAEAMGVSLNHYVGMSLAARVGAQAARFFAARGSRSSTEQALSALTRVGGTDVVIEDDRLDAPSL